MVASVLAFLGLGSVVGAVGVVAKGAGSKIAVDATVKVTQGTLKRVTDHLTDQYELPQNHDIFQTLDGKRTAAP